MPDLDFVEEPQLDFQPEAEQPSIDKEKEHRRAALQSEAEQLRTEARANQMAESLFGGAENAIRYGIAPLRNPASVILNAPRDIGVGLGIIGPQAPRSADIPIGSTEGAINTFLPRGGVVEQILRATVPNKYQEPVIEGTREFVGELAGGATAPSSIGTLATGRPGLIAMGAQGAAEIPETIQRIQQAANEGDPSAVVKESLNLALQTGGAVGAARMGTSATKGIDYASKDRTTTPIHGDVRAQPESSVRKVPAEEGGPGIQSQAPRKGEAGTPAAVAEATSLSVADTGIPSAQDIGKMSLEEFTKFHDALGDPAKQREGVNDLAVQLGTVRQIKEAEQLAAESRAKTKAINEELSKRKDAGESYQQLGKTFKDAQMENQRTQFLDEAVRTAKARDAVASGMSVEDAAGNMGVHEPSLRSVIDKAQERVLASKSEGQKPAFAERYPQETLFQIPAWVEPGSAFDKVLNEIREKKDPFFSKDVTGIWNSLTTEQKRDLNARGWNTKPTRTYGQVVLHAGNDALAARTYYGAQNRRAARGDQPLESRTGTGLPPSVPDRGPDFSADLMEAARQLDAVVRSRATLRPGVSGQFVRRLGQVKKADRIEVGDIDNQLTVSHEIGHNVDTVIFPHANLATSQESLVQRIGRGDKKTLFNELKLVSELMRGPMTGSKGHVQYRKSATELIADYFALYAHDPERARAMAPTWSAGFEEQLANHPDAAGVVRQLTEGSVAPTPAERPPSVSEPTAMPGKAGVRTSVEPPVRERQMAEAAQTQEKEAVRKYEEEKQAARIVADRERQLVPDPKERNDAGAFMEGIGNVEIPGDTIEAVRSRMTPKMELFVKHFRRHFEHVRQEVNKFLKDVEEGEYLSFLQDYLPHFYANSKTAIDGAVRRFIKDSPHAKERKLPTLAEARDLGLTPITQDPATLYELSSNINWRAATNRKFLSGLDEIKTIDGTPAIVPWGKAPPGWIKSDSPMLQRIYGRKTPGGVVLWKGGAAVHPDIWPAVRQMIETPVSGDFARAYDAVNSLARAGVFAFSGFHDLTLRLAALGSMFELTNPARGLVRVGERNPITGQRELIRSTRSLGKEMLMDEDAVRDAARSGLHFTANDSESYQKQSINFLDKMAALYGDTPVVGPIGKGLRDLQAWRNKGLWRNTHDAYKLVAFNDAVNKALKSAPTGTDVQAVKTKIASTLNDFYGGQEWQTKFWLSPQMRKYMSRIWLAPDWSLSTLRSIPGMSDVASLAQRAAPRKLGTATSEGLSGAGQRGKVWAAELAAIAAGTVALQYAINKTFGDPKKGDKEWIWDNEYNQRTKIDITPIMRQMPWHDANDPTRHYMNLGKRPEEVMRWINGWDGQVMSKLAPPIHEIITQLTGTEGDFKTSWKRDHETFLESVPDRTGHAAQAFLPFAFRGNQFALTAPSRKGMTKYKAQQAYESVYELAADPDVTTKIRAFMRGVPAPDETQALPEMVTQISDAADANGVPSEQIRQRALSVVRGHHYDLFFKAFQKGDEKVMNDEAEALLRLGATSKGMSESLKRRTELTPQ